MLDVNLTSDINHPSQTSKSVLLISPEVRSILEFLNQSIDESYVVGGAVRDHLLNRPNSQDIDIAIPENGFLFSQKVKLHFPGLVSFAPLDPVNGCGRLIVRDLTNSIIDIAAYKGPSIFHDLSQRDFTINAMAVKIDDFLDTGFHKIQDPLNARQDISNRTVRICASHSFNHDPLRILRAYRFCAQLGFTMDDYTDSLIQETVRRLDEVSGERLRDELCQILSCADAHSSLVLMEKKGVITRLFPELGRMKGCEQNRYHSMDVWKHSMECVAQLENLLKCPGEFFGDFWPDISQYLDFEICPGRSRLWLIKIACLFHDSGKPHTRSVDASGLIHFYGHEKVSVDIFRRSFERLGISNRENEMVRQLILGHMRLSSVTTVSPSKRFLYRVTERFRDEIPGLLLIFISDLKSSLGPARTPGQLLAGIDGALAILRYFYAKEPEPHKPLLTGHDVMNILNLPQGPQIGKILEILKEKQALGEITSREQAIEKTLIIAGRSVAPSTQGAS